MVKQANLTNLFFLVRKKLANYNVIYETPPSYLQKIVGSEKIIFVCKKVRIIIVQVYNYLSFCSTGKIS